MSLLMIPKTRTCHFNYKTTKKQQKVQFFKQEEMSLLMTPKQELVKIINIVNQYSIFNININLKKQTY